MNAAVVQLFRREHVGLVFCSFEALLFTVQVLHLLYESLKLAYAQIITACLVLVLINL
jgi:cytochrome c oxidase subunit IV